MPTSDIFSKVGESGIPIGCTAAHVEMLEVVIGADADGEWSDEDERLYLRHTNRLNWKSLRQVFDFPKFWDTGLDDEDKGSIITI